MPKYREETGQGISNISDIVAMAREFGIGLVVADCDPSQLSDSFKSQAGVRVCFGQTTRKDMVDTAGALALRTDSDRHG